MSLLKTHNIIAVTFVIIFCILSMVFVNGELTVSPTDSEVLLGKSTYFNCSTSIIHKNIHWYFIPIGGTEVDRENVYTFRKLYGTFANKIRVERASHGVFNLVIPSATLEDAGRYDCTDDGGFGETKSAELIVLATNPVCRNHASTNEVVGMNSCGIEADHIRLSCSVNYRGNKPPKLEWKSNTGKSSSVKTVTVNDTGNSVTYKMRTTADLHQNGTYFICETKKSAGVQYNCTSAKFNVRYAFSDHKIMNVSVDDRIICSANTSEVCEYRWKRLQEGIYITESCSAVLDPKITGSYRCDVECEIMKSICLFPAVTVYASEKKIEEGTDLDAAIWAVIILVPLILIVVVVAVVVVLCIKQQNRSLA